MSGRPRLLLLAAGGTIATAPDETGNVRPALTAHDLLHAVPDAAYRAQIVAEDVFRKSSRAMTPDDMCQLAHRIARAVREGVAGVVVTHGTDTMEETAYALALQLQRAVPIVLTGAMRLPNEPGADGPANLLAALRVAATPEAAALGPVVVMGNEIHLARFVAKVHTTQVMAFASPGFGPIGHVLEGRVHLHVRPTSDDYLGLPERIGARVELIWATAGADGLLVDAAAPVAQGLVVAGTGGGHLPPALAESVVAAATRGLPTILASRTGAGPILEGTYHGIGSETHLLSHGVLPAGWLSPLKARLRLLVALALGRPVGDIFPVG
jgi:L-asparaginase